MAEKVNVRDFVYCHNCKKGFIGEHDFMFVASEHTGHQMDIYRPRRSPEEETKPELTEIDEREVYD